MKHYTIEFSLKETDDDGNCGAEVERITLDITSSERYSVEEAMHAARDAAEQELRLIAMADSIHSRRPSKVNHESI